MGVKRVIVPEKKWFEVNEPNGGDAAAGPAPWNCMRIATFEKNM